MYASPSSSVSCAWVCVLEKHFSLPRALAPATTTPNVVCHFKSVPWVASEVELWAKGNRRKWHCRILRSSSFRQPSLCECANNKVKMKWLGTNGKASVYMKSRVGLQQGLELVRMRMGMGKRMGWGIGHTHTQRRSHVVYVPFGSQWSMA